MEYSNSIQTLGYDEWLLGWRTWASSRKRGRLAQFIVTLLEKGEGAKWVDIAAGKFELTEWHSIAQEWYTQKPRSSQNQDAPCMLRKGLPRAFPDLGEVKGESTKDGTQYRTRMFQCPPELVREVYLCATGQPLPSVNSVKDEDFDDQDGYANYQDHRPVIVDYPLQQNGYYVSDMGSSLAQPYSMQQESTGWNSSMESPHGNDSLTSSPVPPHIAPSNATYPAHGMTPSPSNLSGSEQLTTIQSFADSPGQFSPGSAGPSNNIHNPLLANSTVSSGIASVSGSGGGVNNMATINYTPSGKYYQSGSPPSTSSSRETQPGGGGVVPPAWTGLLQTSSAQQVPSSYPNTSPGLPASEPAAAPYTLLIMRALPSKSPCEGGGEVALIFRHQLPLGPKFVRYQSMNGGGTMGKFYEPRMENDSTLSAPIPSNGRAETVLLQLICGGRVIAQTEFEFFQAVSDDLQHVYQLLNSNMSSFFPTMGGGYGGLGLGGQTGQGSSGGGNTANSSYGFGGGSFMNYAYLLLLGSCKWGCNSFIEAILNLPDTYRLLALPSPNGLPEDIARHYGWNELADNLKGIRESFCVGRDPAVTARASQPTLESLVKQLTGSGTVASPETFAENVMENIRSAAKECTMKKAVENVVSRNPLKEKTTSESTATTATTSDETDVLEERLSQLSLKNTSLSRELELTNLRKAELERNVDSLRQEVEESKEEPITKPQQLKMDRFRRTGSPNMPTKGVLLKNPSIMSDHGICVSFDEDVAQRRLSSIFASGQFSLLSDTTDKSITVTVPGEMNIADSLMYEALYMVTEDYPPTEKRPLFRHGDRIIEVNGSSTRSMNSPQFDDLLRKDLISIKVVPKASNI